MESLAEIARETFAQTADFQTVADAVVAEHERRRWRGIESAPKDGTPIFAWFDGLEFATAVRYQPGDDLSDYVSIWDFTPMAENPTHWTPIPAPPQEVERGA
jgi:hypothetical protein